MTQPKHTYKPIAPICQTCQWARLMELPHETFASAYCGHPETGDTALVISIERDFTECSNFQTKERRKTCPKS